jgi:hypothetical protein
MEHRHHEWSEWLYDHADGTERENYWRECVGRHWPPGCGKMEKVFVHLPKDTQLIENMADVIEPVLSGQYGRDLAVEIALEILGIVQNHQRI